MTPRFFPITVVPALFATTALRADPYLSPQEAVKKMEVPAGFSVDLIAAEPDIVQPIAFTFDARGRLWVVEGNTYPQRAGNPPSGYGPEAAKGAAPNGAPSDAQLKDIMGGKDRVLIFADEDGDGKFESRKVFAEGFNLVSGIELGYGGVFLGAAPYLLHVPDKNGDDKPDGPPEILLDGWGWQDTHETLNTFSWGPDGWLYGCHGVFTHSRVGRPGTQWENTVSPSGVIPSTASGQRVPFNCGYWRFHPTRKVFEVFAHGTSNPWGFDHNEHGDWFSEACVIPHFWHIIPGGYYLRQSNPLGHFNPHIYTNIETIADHVHYIGATPHAGNSVSDAAGGGHAHCGLCIYNGDNFPKEYRGRPMFFNIHGQRINQEELVQQGSGYVAKHLPDFLKTNDKNFTGVSLKVGPDGSVYFIDWYDRQKCHLPKVEQWDRSNGRIYRVKYDSTWKAWKGDMTKRDTAELKLALGQANGWMARISARLLRERGESPKSSAIVWEEDTNAAGLLSRCGTASSPQQRLSVASGLQRLPLDARWTIAEALVSHGEDATDHNLPQMYWYAIEPLVGANPTRALALAEKSRIPLVSEHIARRTAEVDGGVDHLLSALAKEKTGAGVVYLLKATQSGLAGRKSAGTPAAWEAAWNNIEDVLQRRPDAKEAKARAEITDLREALAVAFGDQRMFPRLRTALLDGKAPLDRRQYALKTLAGGKDPLLPGTLVKLLADSAIRLDALQAMLAGPAPDAPSALIAAFSTFSPTEKSAALAVLASRPEFAQTLLDALEGGKIPRTEVPSFIARQVANLRNDKLTDRLVKLWGQIGSGSAEMKQQMIDWKKVLNVNYLQKANLSRGRAVFTQVCGACHTLFGTGGQIGPDLTGSNRADLDYVLENVLDPSAVVGADYQLHIVTLRDGRTLSGMIRDKTANTAKIQLATSAETVANAEISKDEVVPASMMPPGLLATLQRDQVRDLVAYLRSPSQVPAAGNVPDFGADGKVPGALEGENLKSTATAGEGQPQPMGHFPLDRWSGGKQLWWTGGKPGAKLKLEFSVSAGGKSAISAVFSKAIDYGTYRISLDDVVVLERLDCFHEGVVTTGPLSLGEHELKSGAHTLTVELLEPNPKAVPANMFGLDYLFMEPVK